MQYIIVMTLAGSIIVLIFLLLDWIGKERLYARQKYLLLKIALGFYLIPSVPIAMAYREIWLLLQNNIPELINKELPKVEVAKYVIYHTDKGAIFNRNLDVLMLITIIWFLVACIVLLVGTLKSVMEINKMVKCSSKTNNKYIKLLLEKYNEDYRIRRKIDVYECPVRVTPFTVGVFHPKIFVYAKENERDLGLSLKHEMIHIKRGDVLFKQLATLAKYIHWFNPLVYFQRKWIENICELACDEMVIENADIQMRKDYAGLILDNAHGSKEIKVAYGLSSEEILKERISCIMGNEQKKKWNKVFVGLLMGVLVFANSLTALANPVVTEVEKAEFETEVDYGNEFVFTPESEDKIYNIDAEVILYTEQFVDEQGNIYPVNSEEQIGTMTVCIHNYVSGVIQRHIVNSNGGCVVQEYSAKRCTKCGYIVWGEFINSYTYAKCTH